MQRMIFALRGIADSGKTSTISLVYHHFRQQGATVIYGGDPTRHRQKPVSVQGPRLKAGTLN